MSSTQRRILQAVLYEIFAVAFIGPVMAKLFDEPIGSSLGLAVVMSTIALTWNYLFNLMFERWEARQAVSGRSAMRRFVHGLGFEGGLVFILVPVMAFWLHISFLAAFVANLGVFVFFFVYAIVFTWAFDSIFGLPPSAAGGKR
ncbi:MAG: PACE efflux transporter [Ideonella sp.]